MLNRVQIYSILGQVLSRLADNQGQEFSVDQHLRLLTLVEQLPVPITLEHLSLLLTPVLAQNPDLQAKLYHWFAEATVFQASSAGTEQIPDSPGFPDKIKEDKFNTEDASSATPKEPTKPDIDDPQPNHTTANPTQDTYVAEPQKFDQAPYVWNIELGSEREFTNAEELRRLVNRMHDRQLLDARQLDLPRTIQALVKHPGQISLQYQQLTQAPAYLLLIDQRAQQDHRARIFDLLYAYLRFNDVQVQRFYFHANPKWCFNDEFPQGLPVAQLYQQNRSARLLILTYGYELFSPTTNAWSPWTKVFMQWQDRAILSPLPIHEWGGREQKLAERFTLLPATPQGLVNAIETFKTEETQHWQDYLGLITDAPTDTILLQGGLIATLNTYFPDPVMRRWIAACALYPTLNWELTLHLGSLLQQEYAQPSLTSIENLLQLVRLPWFVEGRIPDSARDELLQWLELIGEEARIRQLLLDSLNRAPAPPEGSVAYAEYRMQVVFNQWMLEQDPARKSALEEEFLRLVESGMDMEFVTLNRLNRAANRNEFEVPKSWQEKIMLDDAIESVQGIGVTDSKFIKMYGKDQQRRDFLAKIANELNIYSRSLNLNNVSRTFQNLYERIQKDTFKIIVIGEFNTGKTTLINALLGADFLPTKPIPANHMPVFVRYGIRPQAFIHYVDITKKTFEVSIEQLEDYLYASVSHMKSSDQFKSAEILLPLSFCKAKIEIIDFPGINESKIIETQYLDYAQKADLILFVMSALRFGPNQHELQTLNALKKLSTSRILYIMNQIDMLRPRDRSEVENRAINQLENLSVNKEDIHLVDSLFALKNREVYAARSEEIPHFGVLEKTIHTYLSGKISIAKATQTALKLREEIKLTRNSLRTHLESSMKKEADFSSNLALTSGLLNELRNNRKQLINVIEENRNATTSNIKKFIQVYFLGLHKKIEAWVSTYEIQSSGSLISKLIIERTSEKLVKFLSEKTSEDFKIFEKELESYVSSQVIDYQLSTNEYIIRIEKELDLLNHTLLRYEKENTSLNYVRIKNPFERILAAAQTNLQSTNEYNFNNALAAITMITLGELSISFLLGITITISWPIAIIASLLAGRLFSFDFSNRIKAEVQQNFLKAIDASANEFETKILKKVDQNLKEFQNSIDRGMTRQINDLSKIIERNIVTYQEMKGVAIKDAEEIEYAKLKLSQIDSRLKKFIDEMA